MSKILGVRRITLTFTFLFPYEGKDRLGLVKERPYEEKDRLGSVKERPYEEKDRRGSFR